MSLLIRGMKLDGMPHKALLTKKDGNPVLVVETQYSYIDNEVKVYEVEEVPSEDVRHLVFCRDCKHRDPEDPKRECGSLERAGCGFSVSEYYYYADGERRKVEKNEK